MREVTAIDPKWLVELAPRFFKAADPNKMTKRKRQQHLAESEGGGVGIQSDDLGVFQVVEQHTGKTSERRADKRKLVSKWHPTTKGTIRRNYRVPSKSEGRRVLKSHCLFIVR
ncbi:hypothetical protein J5N97_000478 [Dioscorea zingiberensis]|uniref:Uncharacterized protein n=1 Tax=Dioscorea zingiberensis TaxID=325984 RepID=A0A9D5BSA6_9LILI|nr:hypothetical protein J5N97_000478 [Dioscorea zingiberensis]